MNNLKEKISLFNKHVTFESLGEFVKSINIDEFKYEAAINNPINAGDYGRYIHTLEPFECVLINWPAEVESAVHYHKGLFGYVLVLEGELDNISYELKNNQLIEHSIERFRRKGIAPEPDGIIHNLRNNSKNKRAITLHFYYPAIHSFEGMEIFNLEKCAMGVLSKNAKTAKWTQEQGHFKEIHEKAFEFISFEKLNDNKSHHITYLNPKPSDFQINKMNAAYFGEQSMKYDFSDFNQPNRKLYIDSIDQIIASSIKEKKEVLKHLDIATGTGRRALRIKELSNRAYEIVGVDISKDMCKIAESRGLRTFHQDWANDDTHIEEFFDVITFLYAFGHLASEQARITTLKKIASYLTDNGTIYFDVFSLKNINEWGGLADQSFIEKNMKEFGYQRGDIFYRKKGLNEIAFIHYFTLKEINLLMKKCGLKVTKVKYVGYSKNPGALVSNQQNGNILIEAQKN